MNIRAYAKINIGLRVLKKRPDGYHDLETILHRIDVHDTVSVDPSPRLEFTCDSKEIPSDDSNLCLRAAHVMQEEFQPLRGARITLSKRIPVGAGLGGGSSDAASTLLVLNRFWNLNASPAKLHTLALALGSDVPYFLTPGTARATGRGEVLSHALVDLPFWILTVYPSCPVSTAWAYRQLEGMGDRSTPISIEILSDCLRNPEELKTRFINDLEAPVFRTYPAIARIKLLLLDAGAVFAQMSGSGSSVYGFFGDAPSVQRLSTELSKEYRVFVTSPHFQPAGQIS